MPPSHVRHFITISLLFAAASALWAAKAPLSDEALQKEASHVISGKVMKVTSKNKKSTIETSFGIHRDTVFTISLKVAAVSKGTEVKVGDEITVKAWQPARRIPAPPGLQGHESIPQKGEAVTIFATREQDKTFSPILPNGIRVEK